MHTNSAGVSMRVQVQIVTYNNADVIGNCLDSVLQQTIEIARIVVIDNDSKDHTVELIEQHFGEISIIRNPANFGYAGGHNVGFSLAIGDCMDYVLTLNPDVELFPDYVALLLDEMNHSPKIGGISGKLLRMQSENAGRQIIDSTGLVMQRLFHVRDRDAGVLDMGQRDTAGPVWGVCGAAALYRVSMLKDLVYMGRVFDESFFVYKEDVDLCWRAQRRNWTFSYFPNATALHRRSWAQGSKMSANIVAHSFANQIALLIRHTPRRGLRVILAVGVELLRFLSLLVRRPTVATQAAFIILHSWSYHLRVRRQLQEIDIAKERNLYDISYPGHL